VEPIRFAATLRDRFRPTQAGIQIHFSLFVCTLGFNVSHSGGRSFVTNSHCTDHQGGVEGTEYAQPSRSVDPTVIAIEAADPEYFTWRENVACPVGRRCRYSDASRARYSDAVESSQGLIARTTGPNNRSITVDVKNPFFEIVDQDNATTRFKIGTEVNKVGRSSGWTQGPITRTCVHTNVFGSNITQLCQTFVAAGVIGGDSGSPVFTISGQNRATLVGILWGGSGSSLYVFSPLKQIRDELGGVTATTTK
ncbi:MAG: S1 family peptidase, partial [Gemmatimonadota bacterium]|nr:S1 family peptidase [Gemmatimonadota bacterium]